MNRPQTRTNHDGGIGVIGVAGCGAMGLPMARNLLAAGFETWGFDIRPADEFGDFAPRMLADPAEFAARCDTVLSVVRNAEQTLDLCFNTQKILRQDACSPSLLLTCSTLSPKFIKELVDKLPLNTELVDAPMSGAPHAAKSGTLTFMLGGNAATLDRIRPLIDAMGDQSHRLGDTGAGMTAKVLNNYVAACSVAATRRVLAAAPQLGLEPGRLREVMAGSSGGNWYANQYQEIPWARENYASENTIGILEKDVRCALDAMATLPDAASPLDAALLAALRSLPAAPEE